MHRSVSEAEEKKTDKVHFRLFSLAFFSLAFFSIATYYPQNDHMSRAATLTANSLTHTKKRELIRLP